MTRTIQQLFDLTGKAALVTAQEAMARDWMSAEKFLGLSPG